MYRCRPSKWILPAIVGAGLPLLAGWALSGGVKEKFAASCSTALSGVGADWAKCETDGFAAKITGEAPDEAAIAKAVTAVETLPGIRGIQKVATVAPPPPPPEVMPIPADLNPEMDAVFKGKWPSAVATALAIGVGAKTYELGKSPELTATGDEWSLNLGKTLAPGNYELAPKVTDKFNRVIDYPTIKFTVNDPPPPPEPPKVEEPTPPPPPAKAEIKTIEMPPMHNPPTVDRVSSDQPVGMITGTWDSTLGKRLRVKVLGKTYSLGGADGALKNEGDKWMLSLAEPLASGSYEVMATSSDAMYRLKNDSSNTEILVSPQAKPAEVAPMVDAAAPTVNPQKSEAPISVISGTWDGTNAKRLRVSVPSKNLSTRLGNPALTTDGNNWSWKLDEPLGEGTYEVLVTSSDADYRAKSDSSKEELMVTIPPPPTPEAGAPTVNQQTSAEAISVITGTWDSTNAQRLRISVPVRGLNVRKGDPALKTEGNNWSLTLAEPLGPGSYEVTATSSDADFRPKSDGTTSELIVLPPAPKPAEVAPVAEAGPPAVNSVKTTQPVSRITGRWDSTNAKRLRLAVVGKGFATRLGNAELSTVGDSWTWTLPEALPEGTYEVVATTSDADFRAKSDASTSEIMVMAPPAPEPAPAAEPAPAPKPIVSDVKIPEARPIDCVAVLNRINQVFPIRFEVNKTNLLDRGQLAVSQYIALLKDPRCASLKVSLSGHADLRGSFKYNQKLSNGRVNSVKKAMVDAGVDTARFVAKGFSESVPVDAARTEEAFAKNRRVEVTAAQ